MHAGRDENSPFAREQARLRERTVTSLVQPGAPFPDAPLLTAGGDPTTLAATLAGSPAVVIFYRGAWCPYCNLALATYRRELAADLAARAILLVAISPEHPDGSLSMQEKQELSFPVLSDPGNQIAGALGILTRPSDEVLEAQRGRGFDLRDRNADGTVQLPMPTTAIVGRGGELLWIDIHPDHTSRTEPAEIRAALDSLAL